MAKEARTIKQKKRAAKKPASPAPKKVTAPGLSSLRGLRYLGATYLGRAVHFTGTFGAGFPKYLVQHYTAGGEGIATAKMLVGPNDREVSVHFTIARAGTVWQTADLDQCCHHAGKSQWRGTSFLNRFSLGIENENYGFLYPRSDGKYLIAATATAAAPKGTVVFKGDPVVAEHKDKYGGVLGWEPYPPKQIEENLKLSRWLLENVGTLKEIVGHDDISPVRKKDPGPAWPWQPFKDLINPDSQSEPNRIWTVNATTLNVRGGPGTNFEVLRSLSQGAVVTVVQDTGDWSLVEDADGKQGWVFDQYLALA